jgi:ADP-heptose:LPS heptosyltransferase
MKKIIISPYSRRLRGKDTENPKNYPYWDELVELLTENNYYIIQVGVEGEKRLRGGIGGIEYKFNLPLKELKKLVEECDAWISVDNFFQHFCSLVGKPGIVLFGQSDPLIFGHPENINLLKDRKYLRPDQFNIWEACEQNKEAFVEPRKVLNAVLGE